MPSVNRKVIVNPPRTLGSASDYTHAIQDEASQLVVSRPVNKLQTPLLRLYRTPILATFTNRYNPFTPTPWTGGGGGGGPAPDPTPSYANVLVRATSLPSSTWKDVSSSSDGMKLLAVGSSGAFRIGTRSGSGQTFSIVWSATSSSVITTPAKNWVGCAMSADGSVMFASATDGIYRSIDGGSTWSKPTALVVNALACSANGYVVLAATTGGTIYRASDRGSTFVASDAPNTNWSEVSISSDGTKATASVNGGRIWTSVTGGATWLVANTPDVTNREYYSVAISGDGTKIYTGANGGVINVGTFNGTAWVFQALTTGPVTNPLWFSFAASQDGSKFIAGTYAGDVYASIDGGATTIPRILSVATNNLGTQWKAITTSSDGTKFAAVNDPGNSVGLEGAYY